jgi:hypothetical protein
LWPFYTVKTLVSREFEHDFSGYEISDNSSPILCTRYNEVVIFKAPRHRKNAWLMKVFESFNWILWISEIPNIEPWVSIVIIGDNKLSWYHRIPHHLGLFQLYRLSFWLVRLRIEVVVLWNLVLTLVWLHKLENRFALLQVPNNNFSIFRSTCQNMRHNSIPANRCDSMALVKVGLAGFEFCWFL